MDWKVYYRAEIARSGGRDPIAGFIRSGSDPRVEGMIDRGGVVSFPHTALPYAGPLQGRLVSALYRRGIERIVALGVLHGSGIEAFKIARDERRPIGEREVGFAQVKGGIVPPEGPFDTPFGGYPVWRPADYGPVRIDRSGILTAEFSLDTFASILKVGAEVFGKEEIPIFPVYVGMTRDPIEGGFDLAFDLAEWLRRVVRDGTALVTTGDLVHYGTAYAAPGEAIGDDDPSLAGRFRAEVERMLDAGLIEGDLDEAYRSGSEELKSDQREILPVIRAFTGGKGYEILEFELSDYVRILSVDPPCYVASALLTYG